MMATDVRSQLAAVVQQVCIGVMAHRLVRAEGHWYVDEPLSRSRSTEHEGLSCRHPLTSVRAARLFIQSIGDN